MQVRAAWQLFRLANFGTSGEGEPLHAEPSCHMLMHCDPKNYPNEICSEELLQMRNIMRPEVCGAVKCKYCDGDTQPMPGEVCHLADGNICGRGGSLPIVQIP